MSNVMRLLFDDFEAKGVPYLHFKSNTNLDSSFEGNGDFDVLVDPMYIAQAESSIARHGGKRFNPPRLGRYPGVDNWMLLDEESGVLHHLHLHYQLATGKALVKDYILPWRELLLESRMKDDQYGIYVSDPNFELLMLLVRTVLKSTFAQRLRARLKSLASSRRLSSVMFPSMEKEFQDLKARVSKKDFEFFAKKCGFSGNDLEMLSDIAFQERIGPGEFFRLSSLVRKVMANNRRMAGLQASVLSLYYTLRRRVCSFLKNHTDQCFMIRKVHDTNGLIIAFVGVDGSGKSTITKEICRWLRRKIECRRFYMGSGDGSVPLSMRLLKTFKRRGQKKRANTVYTHADGHDNFGKGRNALDESKGEKAGIRTLSFFRQPIGFVRRMLKMKALYDVQNANYKKIRIMQRYRLNGGISLLDRYPQIEVNGVNDGPKISGYVDSFVEKGWVTRLMKKEMDRLGIVREIKPDIIFRLNISAETSMKRKPEQKDIELFRQKVRDLEKITFQGALIIDIDAGQPFEEEVLMIKKILWGYM